MGPIEILWTAIVLFFVFIAMVRGYAKELGVTTLIFVALFLIAQFGEKYLPLVINMIVGRLGIAELTERATQHALSSVFSLILIGIVFASYAGETFTLRGTAARGPMSVPLNLLVGSLNGCLVAGALWYFQDAYKYPFADFGILVLPLTPFAERLAAFLPLYIVPPLFWAGMVMVLLLVRVRK